MRTQEVLKSSTDRDLPRRGLLTILAEFTPEGHPDWQRNTVTDPQNRMTGIIPVD